MGQSEIINMGQMAVCKRGGVKVGVAEGGVRVGVVGVTAIIPKY